MTLILHAVRLFPVFKNRFHPVNTLRILRFLTASILASLAGPVDASRMLELHQAWNTEQVDRVVELRELLEATADPRTEFQADYMVATAQCGTPNKQRQRAGIALLQGLPSVYPGLDLSEIGTVYVAVRRCRDIINGKIAITNGESRSDQWIDPTDVAALIIDAGNHSSTSITDLRQDMPSPESNNASDNIAPGSAVNIITAARNDETVAYNADDICDAPCNGESGGPGVTFMKLRGLGALITNYGADSAVALDMYGEMVGAVQTTTHGVHSILVQTGNSTVSEDSGLVAREIEINDHAVSLGTEENSLVVASEPPTNPSVTAEPAVTAPNVMLPEMPYVVIEPAVTVPAVTRPVPTPAITQPAVTIPAVTLPALPPVVTNPTLTIPTVTLPLLPSRALE